ncbi:Hypothetical protein SMAX5B_007895 [Scophthalmus maximus]|uniref:Uncharacterized protein n=1 Tax=Scophthalmus maximus TaxID=52904 RepID=A0A2U9C9F5_SCOMX|nr:Hypothetical protein SMAX5B_007895 [Scophthalmus maximus]
MREKRSSSCPLLSSRFFPPPICLLIVSELVIGAKVSRRVRKTKCPITFSPRVASAQLTQKPTLTHRVNTPGALGSALVSGKLPKCFAVTPADRAERCVCTTRTMRDVIVKQPTELWFTGLTGARGCISK